MEAEAGAASSGAEGWVAAVETLRGAYADKTIRECIANFRAFQSWCADIGVASLPASPENVAAHVAAVFTRYRWKSVETRLAMIRRVHELMGHSDPTRSTVVRMAVRRGKRTYGIEVRQALGIGADLRDRMLAVCDHSLIGLRDAALVSLGYDSLCRRLELTNLLVEDVEPLADGTARVRVRRSKTDPFGRGSYAYMSARTLQAMRTWLAAAALTDGPILRGVYRTVASERPMNARTINRRLRELARLAGVDEETVAKLSSHSLRVGAAQDLAASGRTLLEIMRAGRWRNVDRVTHYVREAPINVWADGRDTDPVMLQLDKRWAKRRQGQADE